MKFLLKILDGDRQCHNILTRQSGMYCVIGKKALFSTQLRWYTAHLWQKKNNMQRLNVAHNDGILHFQGDIMLAKCL